VHFLDAWTRVSFLDQLRMIAPAALMIAAIALPGRRVSMMLAFAMALAAPLSGVIPGGWPLAVGWGLLWAAIGAVVHRSAPAGVKRPVERAGAFESTFIGLMLGAPMFALLTLAIGRQDLSVAVTRAAVMGTLYATLGLVHLMVRRHVVRSALGWAFLGFGLQVIEGATRGAVPAAFAVPRAATLLATSVTVALVLRLGFARAAAVGSAWLSDAHDLHD
jgi:hypothetical protein